MRRMNDGDESRPTREPDAASPSPTGNVADTADVQLIDDPAPQLTTDETHNAQQGIAVDPSHADEPAGDADDSAALSVLLAPLICLFRPERAARRFLAARTPHFWIGFLLGTFAISATLVGQVVRRQMIAYRWYPPATTLPTTMPISHSGRLAMSTAPEIWSRMSEDRSVHPMLLFAGGMAALVVALAAFVAWLFLPAVHQSGSVRRSFERAFRTVASGVGVLWALVFLLGGYVVFTDNYMDRVAASNQFGTAPELVAPLIVMLPAAVWLLLHWIGRACRAARGPEQTIVIPPMCEGCGYDLTHRPADGLCPECAMSVETSLTCGRLRPGADWENDTDAVIGWSRTSHAALLHPARFYAALQVRTNPEAAARFARCHYVALGSAAGVWMAGLMIASNAMQGAGCFLPCMMMFLAPLCGWLVQRIVGAIAASWWVTRGTLPDVRWATKIIGYETAYLWTYGLYNAAFLSAMVLTNGKFFRAWTNPILERALLGMPLEMAAVVYPNALLSLLWLWRYRIAARAVRWSNF